MGGKKLQGANIVDILPSNASATMLKAIQQALINHEPTMARIEMVRIKTNYQSVIRILPMHQFVIGLVNDFPIQPHPFPPPRTNGLQLGKPSEHLTPREWEVAMLLAKQRSNQEIAHSLNISQRTVKFHISHVLTKLHLTHRAQVQILISPLNEA